MIFRWMLILGPVVSPTLLFTKISWEVFGATIPSTAGDGVWLIPPQGLAVELVLTLTEHTWELAENPS